MRARRGSARGLALSDGLPRRVSGRAAAGAGADDLEARVSAVLAALGARPRRLAPRAAENPRFVRSSRDFRPLPRDAVSGLLRLSREAHKIRAFPARAPQTLRNAIPLRGTQGGGKNNTKQANKTNRSHQP